LLRVSQKLDSSVFHPALPLRVARFGLMRRPQQVMNAQRLSLTDKLIDVNIGGIVRNKRVTKVTLLQRSRNSLEVNDKTERFRNAEPCQQTA
jgi:hypothetical protein